eukprot:m.29322 g.29322  ORF g.29322 m.29322 type:complete len:151 (+) comp9103_c0_seq1:935-1387(+)
MTASWPKLVAVLHKVQSATYPSEGDWPPLHRQQQKQQRQRRSYSAAATPPTNRTWRAPSDSLTKLPAWVNDVKYANYSRSDIGNLVVLYADLTALLAELGPFRVFDKETCAKPETQSLIARIQETTARYWPKKHSFFNFEDPATPCPDLL